MEKSQESTETSSPTETSPIDFTGLILGLSGAALTYLGHLSQAKEEHDSVNLDLVKQNIEILTMLQQKTKGNLDSQEDRILRQIIADLQFRFVEASKVHKK